MIRKTNLRILFKLILHKNCSLRRFQKPLATGYLYLQFFLTNPSSNVVLYHNSRLSYPRLWKKSLLARRLAALSQSANVCRTVRFSALLILLIPKTYSKGSLVGIRELHSFLHASYCTISHRHWLALPTDGVHRVYTPHSENRIEVANINSSSWQILTSFASSHVRFQLLLSSKLNRTFSQTSLLQNLKIAFLTQEANPTCTNALRLSNSSVIR